METAGVTETTNGNIRSRERQEEKGAAVCNVTVKAVRLSTRPY